MPSPKLLAWRQARKNLRTFRKANPKLRAKYEALRKASSYLDKHQELVKSLGLEASNLSEAVQRMWGLIQAYKKDYYKLCCLEQEEILARAEWYALSGKPSPFGPKEKLHGSQARLTP